MVASFPEFDYPKNRSDKGPGARRINLLRNTSCPKSAPDSTLIGKILSFHGSFYSNPHPREVSDESAKLAGKRSCSASVGDGTPANSDVGSQRRGSSKGNAAKFSDTASKLGRKWTVYKAAKSHMDSQNGCHLPQKLEESSAISDLGDLGDQNGKVGVRKTSVISHSGDLGNKEGDLGAQKCDSIEVGDFASRVKNRCTAMLGSQKGNVGTQKGNVGTQRCDSIQLGTDFIKQSFAQNAEGSDITSSNYGYGGNIANCASSNVGGNHADAPAISENTRKISSPVPGAPNFSADNPLYASDNSSNNMRWSSTSCASTDTSSSNGTLRNSCESRISITSAAPPSFLAKPHKAHDVAWAAIRSLQLRQGGAPLGIAHFKLVRRVGHGDIGSVFLAHLQDKLVAAAPDASCLFAIKVMDKDALSKRNKLQRMHMEKEILESVDHPFLPTLYAHFDSEHYSCLVMEFCPGGDLYALRQKQPGKRFRLISARFYAAEVLLALEYLHMLGIVYRDLKPENVLVREDGHIMLTDFDLSLKCDVKPQLLKHPLLSSSSLSISSSSSKRRLMRSYSQSSTISSSSTTSFLNPESTNCRLPVACGIDPIISCLSLTNNSSKKTQQNQNQQLSMVSSKVIDQPHTSNPKDGSIAEPLKLSKQDVHHSESIMSVNKADGQGAERGTSKASTTHSENNAIEASHSSDGTGTASTSGLGCQEDDMMFMELVAEPTQARSMSFVGTHEYLAPEIIAGYGHGSPVDWWTFGIFLYELIFGRTPFKGASNDQTLINIVRQHLRFPMEGMGEIEEVEEAKSLIQGLLVKDPRRRLGCNKGAAEIKQHAFFKGVNWALIRCTQPPEVPSPSKKGMHLSSNHHHRTVSKAHHHFDFF